MYSVTPSCVLTVGFSKLHNRAGSLSSAFPSTQLSHIYISINLGKRFTVLSFSRTHVTRSRRRVPWVPWKRFSLKKRRKNRRMDKRGENCYQFYPDVSQNSWIPRDPTSSPLTSIISRENRASGPSFYSLLPPLFENYRRYAN